MTMDVTTINARLRESIHAQLMNFEDSPEGDKTLADLIGRQLQSEELWYLALQRITDVVWSVRREQARIAERAPQVERVGSHPPKKMRSAHHCRECDTDYSTADAYEAHKRWRRGTRSACGAKRIAQVEERQAALRREYTGQEWNAPKNSRIYREWITTPDGQEYLVRREEERAEEEHRYYLFVHDPAAYDEQYGLGGAIRRLIATVREEARIELTHELLSSTFALGDGQRVTWGTATYEQHQRRITLLEANVLANSETLKRHYAALKLLDEHQVAILNEVVDVNAA